MTQKNFREYLSLYYSSQELTSWFSSLSLVICHITKKVTILFPHVFFEQWFLENKEPLFTAHAAKFFAGYTIQFSEKKIASSHFLQEPQPVDDLSQISFSTHSSRQPHTEHTFFTFLANKKNDFPIAVAKEIAQNVYAPSFCPLIIHGQGGTGKTHLLEAIINDNLARDKNFSYFYGDSNELLHIYAKQGFPFKEQINEKAFFIDDIQRIADYSEKQKECFTLFEYLIREKKTVIVTIDTHPEECKFITPQLRLLFASGLVVKLKKPDIDIRRQYIQHMNNEFTLGLNKADILTLAQRCTDFRVMIGAITRIKAYKLLVNSEHTDLTKIFKSGEQVKQISPDFIIETASTLFSVTAKDITGKSRSTQATHARMACILLFKELLGLSLVQIGQIMGGRNHSSIIYSLKKVKEIQQSNNDINNSFSQLRKLCTS